MKRIISYIFVFSYLSGIILMSGCKKNPGLPTLTTTPISDITFSTAKSGGSISDDGGAGITNRGVCWGTSLDPTILDNVTSEGTGSGDFTSELTNLIDGTVYYVRAYATNSEGTAYGNMVTFNTAAAGVPVVTTVPATEVTFTGAKSGGNITSDEGAAVTARGICWSTSQNPSVTNDKTTDGQGTGAFVSTITGLAEGGTYYVRAYATNKAGTGYGNQITITTPVVKVPEMTTTEVSALTPTAGTSGGNITNNGGSDITERGICWSTSPNPTITNSKTSEGTGSGVFASNLSGLADGTVYYIRSYATNRAGTGYGNQVTITTPVMDVEGNIYKTVAIGAQVWMAENLKTTHYKDNSPIAMVADSLTWLTLTTPAYCYYRNHEYNKVYGALYNWYAAATGNLCPEGWHVPRNAEFQTLELQAGMPADTVFKWGWRGAGIGTHLKSTTGWSSEGEGDNASGFTAIPAGFRAWINAQFRAIGDIAYFWSSTDDAANLKPNVGWYRRLDATSTKVYQATSEKTGGKSIRCVKTK